MILRITLRCLKMAGALAALAVSATEVNNNGTGRRHAPGINGGPRDVRLFYGLNPDPKTP